MSMINVATLEAVLKLKDDLGPKMRRASLAIRPPAPARKGRPRLPEDQRLSEILRFRVTTAEADALWRTAIRQRMPLADYLRALVLRSER